MTHLRALLTAVVFLSAACGTRPPEASRQSAAQQAGPVKIAQFYPAEPIVAPGEAVNICYSVENAESVRLDPSVAELTPSLNRCVQITAARSQSYKLIARGSDGTEVSASFDLKVSGAARSASAPVSAASGPLITSFTAEPSSIAAGEPPVKLCFQAPNAKSATIEPKVADFGTAVMGCFYAPTKTTTTYVLTASGSGGAKDSRRVTVTVR